MFSYFNIFEIMRVNWHSFGGVFLFFGKGDIKSVVYQHLNSEPSKYCTLNDQNAMCKAFAAVTGPRDWWVSLLAF